MQKDNKSDLENNNDEELLACFKLDDFRHFHTGMLSHYVYPMTHSKAHENHIPHIIIRLFAKTIDGKYLVQKRSMNKERHTGRWTDSASGHVRCSEGFKYEDIEKAVSRELSEEMGCNLLDLRFCKMYLAEIGIDRHELNYIYVGIVDNNLNVTNDEVDEKSGFYSKTELIELLKLPEIPEPINNPEIKSWVTISKEMWEEILSDKFNYLFEDMLEEIRTKKNIRVSEKNNNEDQEVMNIATKKEEIGLIIGRFQPLHLGHMYLMEQAFKYVEKLKIGIGSAQFSDQPSNPFSYDERKLFIDLSLADNNISTTSYRVFPIPDQFDFEKWISYIIENTGNFDVIFTNNLWIGRIFQLRGKKLIYGLKYNFEKYNGTRIRELINKNKAEWTILVPKSVKMYITDPKILKRLKKIEK